MNDSKKEKSLSITPPSTFAVGSSPTAPPPRSHLILRSGAGRLPSMHRTRASIGTGRLDKPGPDGSRPLDPCIYKVTVLVLRTNYSDASDIPIFKQNYMLWKSIRPSHLNAIECSASLLLTSLPRQQALLR